MLYRQGDLLFRRLKRKPWDAGKLKKGKIILEGEATGHAHKLDDDSDAELYDWLEVRSFSDIGPRRIKSNRCHLRIVSRSKIVHDEHAPVELDPGWYEIVRQREFDGKDIRVVTD